MANTFIQEVASRQNTNIIITSDLTAETHIKTIIEEIRSDRNTHIELDQFFLSFDVYQQQESTIQQLREQINALTKDALEQTDLSRQLHNKLNERTALKSQILQLALTLQQNRETTILKEIKTKYLQGELLAANQLLPESLLLENQHFFDSQLKEYLDNKKQLEILCEKLVDNSNEFLVKAEITALNYDLEDRYDKSIFYFDKGLLSAKRSKDEPLLFHFNFEYAFFYATHKKHNDAIEYYTEALKWSRELAKVEPNPYATEVGVCLQNIAMAQTWNNDIDSAEKNMLEAIRIFEKWMKYYKSKTIVSAYLNSIINLAVLNIKAEYYEKALYHLEEVFRVFKQLKQKDSTDFLAIKAYAWSNLGAAKNYLKDYPGSYKATKKSKQLFQILLEDNYEQYVDSYTDTCMNLGTITHINGKTEKAFSHFDEALDLVRKLMQKNPERYSSKLGNILHNLARFHKLREEFTKAEKFSAEALDLYRKLEAENSAAYINKLGRVLIQWADLKVHLKEYDLVEQSYKEAGKIYKYLSEKDPAKYEDDLAAFHHSLAFVAYQKEDWEQCLEECRKAYPIRKRLYEQDAIKHEYDYSETLNLLGIALSKLNKGEESISLLETAYKIKIQLAEKNPEAYQFSLANFLNNYAFALKEIGNTRQAQHFLNQAIVIFTKIAQEQARGLKGLEQALNNLNLIQQPSIESIQNHSTFNQLLEVRKQLIPSDPNKYLYLIADMYKELGDEQYDNGEWQSAVDYYNIALEYYHKLMEINPMNLMPNMAETYFSKAEVLEELEELEAAERAYLQSTILYEKLITVNPDQFEAATDLAFAYNNLGNMRSEAGDLVHALLYYKKAQELRVILVENDPIKYGIDYADTILNLALFYQEDQPNQELSVRYADLAHQWYSQFVPGDEHAAEYRNLCTEVLEYWKKNNQ